MGEAKTHPQITYESHGFKGRNKMLLHANIVVCMWIHVSEVGGWVGGGVIF